MHSLPRTILIIPVLSLLWGCDEPAPPEPTASVEAEKSFRIDPDRITVSGISSGAYMAGQLHVAYSGLFSGAGLLAGGPYQCAGGSMSRALGPCVKGGDVGIAGITARIYELVESGAIDDSDNLRDDRVWIFHGAADETVDRSVSLATGDFYRQFLDSAQLVLVTDVNVVHGMPTLSEGHPCDTFAAPFLNACDYDAAGELLKQLYGPLNPPADAVAELLPVSQAAFEDAELTEQGWLYAPEECRSGAECGLHVAFHGCAQSDRYVGDAFVTGAGYNRWAETNRLLVLYPQAESSKLSPVNPLGCWDWWGYTGEDYATKTGPQMIAIRAMIDSLIDGST